MPHSITKYFRTIMLCLTLGGRYRRVDVKPARPKGAECPDSPFGSS
jgi:hypothetical protein